MLGERLSDPVGAETDAGTVEPGLGLLAVETFFEAISEKITLQSRVQIDESAVRGLFAHLRGHSYRTYQIHLGRTGAVTGRNDRAGTWAFQTDASGADGWLSADGWCAGCYLHGLFENDNFRQGMLAALEERRSSTLPFVVETERFQSSS